MVRFTARQDTANTIWRGELKNESKLEINECAANNCETPHGYYHVKDIYNYKLGYLTSLNKYQGEFAEYKKKSEAWMKELARVNHELVLRVKEVEKKV